MSKLSKLQKLCLVGTTLLSVLLGTSMVYGMDTSGITPQKAKTQIAQSLINIENEIENPTGDNNQTLNKKALKNNAKSIQTSLNQLAISSSNSDIKITRDPIRFTAKTMAKLVGDLIEREKLGCSRDYKSGDKEDLEKWDVIWGIFQRIAKYIGNVAIDPLFRLQKGDTAATEAIDKLKDDCEVEEFQTKIDEAYAIK